MNTLSKGNRTRMLLATALSRKSSLLIFDEPTEGLDPAELKKCCQQLQPARRKETGQF